MSNSGIYIRSPDTGHLSRVGMEVQIVSNAKAQAGETPAAFTGRRPASPQPDRPVGEWNTMRIVCLGSAIEVTLNGSLVMQTNMGTNAMLRDRPRKGFIGLANWMGQAQGVEFRNIWIKELAPHATGFGAGVATTIPRRRISAWKGKSGMWNMKSGDFVGTPSAPPSYSFLFSPKPYADFELQFQARLRGDQDNSGVQIRSEVLDTTAVVGPRPAGGSRGAGTWGGLYGEQLQIQGGWLVESNRLARHRARRFQRLLHPLHRQTRDDHGQRRDDG